MRFKERTKPKELTTLELLNYRMKLTTKEQQHYLNLKKGYEGELIFDTLTEKLKCECLILNDLLLEINNTTFQIDSAIIASGKFFFYEVKNYEGDYFYDSDKLYKTPKKEMINPLHQLSRSESLLSQLLLNLGIKLPIDASVVFINPTFTLYQAPIDQPIILPTQVKSYLSNLNAMPSKITDKHRKVAEQLLSLHITDSPYKQVPSYNYKQLRKGIICPKCSSFSVYLDESLSICRKCQYTEQVKNSVIRSINEFKILFPEEKITTNIIYDWCQIVSSKKRIRRILLDNFNRVGNHRWSYYV